MIPPNVTVAQARDLCMLRFNVWNRLIGAQEATAEFGLFWPTQSEWLDNQMLLSMYQLVADDKLELQDRRSFIQVPIDTSRLSSEYSKRSQVRFYTAQTKWCKGWLELLDDNRTLVCSGLQGNLVWTVDLLQCQLVDQDGIPQAPQECYEKYLCLEVSGNCHVVGVDSLENYQEWSDILRELNTASDSEKEEATSVASSIYQTPQHSHQTQLQISKLPRCFTASVYNQSDWTWGVLVNNGLYGFADSNSACDSTEEAQFSLPFTHGSSMWMATTEQDKRYLVHICSADNILVLDVGSSKEQCQQWANAVCGIAGLGLLPTMCREGEEEEDGVSQKSSSTCMDESAVIKKCPSTQSFVSSISQIEWPVPPSTLPDNKIGKMFSDTKPPRAKASRLHFLKWSSS